MPPSVDFRSLLTAARTSAVHLEMRDGYRVGDELEDFSRWRRTGARNTDPASGYWAPWVDLIKGACARGVGVRRARVVSEPVSSYVRYEHAGTVVNILAGEQVRWLPRRQAATLLLPGADLWLFDGETVLFNHFTGVGEWAVPDMELSRDPGVVKQCVDSFEAVWERAIPHDRYEIR
jgi:hypothetical protein